jgi:outer membrane receptor protein involved in Fe transport
MTRRICLPLSLAVLFLTCAVPALAQFQAVIQGTVIDASGAVVPGAKVTATNQETGKVSTTITSGEGFYRISALAPGTYTVVAEASNFKKATYSNIKVDAETPRGLDPKLQVGNVQESVQVTAEAPEIETENGNVVSSLSTLQINRLPQNGRDPYELLRLTPGVFGTGARDGAGSASFLPNGVGPGGSNTSIFQTENQVQISANGQRVSSNSYQIDGVGVNSQTWGGAAVVTPNQESVKEVTVSSSSYSAEDGRTSGAQVKVVSKNGTNAMHGSLFGKYDEPGLNAFNTYASGFGTLKPKRVETKSRQFGGSIGGPIKKDKLFYFFSYEGLRVSSNNTGTAWVETPQYRALVTQLRAGGNTAKIFGLPGIAPRIVTVQTPSCQVFNNDPTRCRVVAGGLDIGSPIGATGSYVSLGNPTGGGFDGIPDIQFVQFVAPQKQSGTQYNGRVDLVAGKNQFAFSTYISKLNDMGADPTSGAGRPIDDVTKLPQNTAAMVSWIRTISDTMLNEARFNVTRFAYNQVANNGGTNFGIPRIQVEGMPFDRIQMGPIWSETTPGIFAENTFEFRDTLTKVLGVHALKFGIQLTREQNNNNLDGGARPLYSFSGLFNLANGTPIFEQINADPRTGGPPVAQRYFRTPYYGGFVQDDWKVRPNLTLNIGLRYEYFAPLHEANGTLSNLTFGPNGLIDSVVKPTSNLYHTDRNNFAPRFGFAWSPAWFAGKGVFRGGYGLSYNRLPNQIFQNTRGNPPYFARYSICCGTSSSDFSTPFAGGTITYVLGSSASPFSYPVNPALAQGIDSVTGAAKGGAVEIYGSPQNMPNAYVHTYSLETQYQFPANLTMTLGYQGSIGRKLIRLVNQNFLQKPSPNWYAVYFPTPDVNSSYNALNARLTRRFSHGLQFDAIYTWSKSMDFLSNEGPGSSTNQTDPAHLRTEKGPSDFDHTHSIVFSAIYDIPLFRTRNDALGSVLGGWTISTIVTAYTGFPWTPVTGRQQSVPITGANTIGPTRPIAYLGGAGFDSSNSTFMMPNGNFPGGGLKYFDVSKPGPPGIGRNSFRGPGYRAIDLTLGKRTRLPFLHIGEDANLDFRANIFNVFNTLNLAPFGFATSSTFIEDSHFGQAESALAGRVVEFQARFSF